MLEIEIKAVCHNHKEVIEKVINLGGELAETLYEKDLYFNHPARDFASTDEALRLRQQNNHNKITYKGPKLSEKSKTRFEAETSFDDFTKMETILIKLGFVKSGIVEKNRTVYLLDGITICFDEVKGAGNFVELEKVGLDKETIEQELFELAARLQLTTFERRSYLELLLQ